MSLTLMAAQLNAVRASLVAGLEQCDAMVEVLKSMATAPQPPAPEARKDELKDGERLFTTFGGAKVPSPSSSAGE